MIVIKHWDYDAEAIKWKKQCPWVFSS